MAGAASALQVLTGIFFNFLTHQLNCFRRDSCNVNHTYRGKPNTHSLITPYLPRENVAAMGDFFPLFLKGEGGGGGTCYFAECNIKKSNNQKTKARDFFLLFGCLVWGSEMVYGDYWL